MLYKIYKYKKTKIGGTKKAKIYQKVKNDSNWRISNTLTET